MIYQQCLQTAHLGYLRKAMRVKSKIVTRKENIWVQIRGQVSKGIKTMIVQIKSDYRIMRSQIRVTIKLNIRRQANSRRQQKRMLQLENLITKTLLAQNIIERSFKRLPIRSHKVTGFSKRYLIKMVKR
mgnify:CR=1 FL=1